MDFNHAARKRVEELYSQQKDSMTNIENITTMLVNDQTMLDDNPNESNAVDLVGSDGRLGKEIAIVDTKIHSTVTTTTTKVNDTHKHPSQIQNSKPEQEKPKNSY